MVDTRDEGVSAVLAAALTTGANVAPTAKPGASNGEPGHRQQNQRVSCNIPSRQLAANSDLKKGLLCFFLEAICFCLSSFSQPECLAEQMGKPNWYRTVVSGQFDLLGNSKILNQVCWFGTKYLLGRS